MIINNPSNDKQKIENKTQSSEIQIFASHPPLQLINNIYTYNDYSINHNSITQNIVEPNEPNDTKTTNININNYDQIVFDNIDYTKLYTNTKKKYILSQGQKTSNYN